LTIFGPFSASEDSASDDLASEDSASDDLASEDFASIHEDESFFDEDITYEHEVQQPHLLFYTAIQVTTFSQPLYVVFKNKFLQ
jgi:hypothetical protein